MAVIAQSLGKDHFQPSQLLRREGRRVIVWIDRFQPALQDIAGEWSSGRHTRIAVVRVERITLSPVVALLLIDLMTLMAPAGIEKRRGEPPRVSRRQF